jgi:hypothetical protein
MTEFYNPDSWMDLVDHLWIGVVFILIAGVPTWISARNHKKLGEIKDQVVNGHEQPMRFDLDRAIDAIETLSHDVRGLRKDLMAEQDWSRVQFGNIRDDLDNRTGKHRRT